MKRPSERTTPASESSLRGDSRCYDFFTKMSQLKKSSLSTLICLLILFFFLTDVD